jgi:hypothetical protein
MYRRLIRFKDLKIIIQLWSAKISKNKSTNKDTSNKPSSVEAPTVLIFSSKAALIQLKTSKMAAFMLPKKWLSMDSVKRKKTLHGDK